MPKISVIMPVYNTKEEYLREAIESILNQTYADFEFIILNDGSTNNSEDVILSYQDKRIRYIKNETNLGLIQTLNKGINEAEGQYLARMDSDDISLKTRFEKQIEFMDKNTDVGVLGTWWKTFPYDSIVKHPSKNEEIKAFLRFQYSVLGHPTVMIRKSILDEYSLGYKEEDKHAEDYGLWLSMIEKTNFANLEEILLNYRWHDENVSVIHSQVQSQNANRLRLEAQKNILKIDTNKILAALNKVTEEQQIGSEEFTALIDYLEKITQHMSKFANHEIWTISIYKSIVKSSKRDVTFLKHLWDNKLNELMKSSLYFRLKNSLRGWK